MTEPTDGRQRLAEALRGLRADAGVSTTQLAERLGWSQSKVSKTERGVTLPSPSDVDAWALATGAPSELRADLVDIAEQSGVEVTEWRREVAPGRRRVQEDIQRLEEAASVIRVFAPLGVVGLAQTYDYATAIFQRGRKGGPVENLDDIVRARLARQAVLADEGKRFEFVMGEGALRRRLITGQAMRGQLARLSELSERPNIGIGVIRFDADELVHPYHGYAVLGDPDLDDDAIVTAETVTRGLTVRKEAEVREYVAHFDALRAAATEGVALRAFLRDLIDDLPVD